MKRCTVFVDGFAVSTLLSREQIKAMWKAGIDVQIVENSVPEWVVDLGMLRLWCWFQDLFHFRFLERKK